ncbi:hypothetical protein [Microvirga pudoricolor]|uniref:hypothetical protein n=1 Tax=Microvirga pudoricolor TaxID=2778729 RepID=UPI0019525004|nr:hypothetical protein [Microvirga pudoricolor]MBM6592744.1 hypothetical protein [Microvirga pudoricolor]
MANENQTISDRALAVFAFAAYHELESGQPVRSVARADQAGHKADDEAVAELTERGFVETDENYIRFTPTGEQLKQNVIDGLRGVITG